MTVRTSGLRADVISVAVGAAVGHRDLWPLFDCPARKVDAPLDALSGRMPAAGGKAGPQAICSVPHVVVHRRNGRVRIGKHEWRIRDGNGQAACPSALWNPIHTTAPTATNAARATAGAVRTTFLPVGTVPTMPFVHRRTRAGPCSGARMAGQCEAQGSLASAVVPASAVRAGREAVVPPFAPSSDVVALAIGNDTSNTVSPCSRR